MGGVSGLDFLGGGGELGKLIRAKDWSGTPLGPPEGWDADNVDWSVGSTDSQRAGDDWLAGGETLLLRVPSVVVPVGWNYLLNPAHADARRVATRRIAHRPDPRLW